jgi:uridine kinase
MPEKKYMYGATIVIVEGIFVLHDPLLRSLLDLKIYVQADSDLMLARRIKRDIVERGRDVVGILDQYLRYVKPSMDNFVSQTSKHADIIVPGENNDVAIDVISQQVWRQLKLRDDVRLRHELSRTPATPRREVQSAPFDQIDFPLALTSGRPVLHSRRSATSMAKTLSASTECHQHPLQDTLSPNIHLLPQTSQLQGLLTLLHDENVIGEDFVYTVDRLSSLVMESAMAFLPYSTKAIRLKTNGSAYTGTELAMDHICSVSILRSGSVLQSSARRVLPALASGSLLIQSTPEGEAKLYTIDLPPFIKNQNQAAKSWVLILDSQIGTGAAALMCIRVLLDHGVLEQNIIFCCLLASAKGGVHALDRAFPAVKIVVAGVDPELKRRRIWDHRDSKDKASSHHTSNNNHHDKTNGRRLRNIEGDPDDATLDDEDHDNSRVCFCIEPGAGNIGDRYFGTGAKLASSTL